MGAARAILMRLRGLFGKERRERELAAEFESHLELQIEDNLRIGMPPEEARRAALLKSGGIEQAKEVCRDRRSLPVLETLLRDLRHSVRMLRRSPAFTAAAVLSLALGIGANTAIFTVLDQLLLRLLPVKDPQRLVMIWPTGPDFADTRGSRAVSYPMYQDFQRRATAFSFVFCQFDTPMAVATGDRTERVQGELVSGNYFQALGVTAAVGRVFSPEEDDRVYMGHPSVVLSHQYWVSRFAADPNVVGRKILVNNYPMVVVGVSAAGFVGLDPSRSPQIRVPIQMKPVITPGWDNLAVRRAQWLHVFARMKPGYTVESARASLEPLFAQILQAELASPYLRNLPPHSRTLFLGRKVMVERAAAGYSQTRTTYSTALVVLMAMVGVVLLIACFNVASLLIARAAARQREVAVRLAIGASRAHLIRQLLVESLLLSAAGGALGLIIAAALTRGLLSFLPAGGAQIALTPALDWRALAFTASLALGTGVLFGLVPALQSTRVDLLGALKDAGRGSSGSLKLRKSLVTAQVAFSFLLLAGAGLFTRTLANLKQTDSGFSDIGRVITFQVDPALSGYNLPRVDAFYTQLLQSIRALPTVKSAGFALMPLLSGGEWNAFFRVEGHHVKDGEDTVAFTNAISPGYLTAMGVPLLDGRDFDERDEGDRVRVAVVNRSFATHYFGGRSPIGRHIAFDGGPFVGDIEIVGEVGDSLYEGPRAGVHRQVLISYPQMNFPAPVSYYVRTSAAPASMFSLLRQKVRELDPAMPVYEMKTLERQLDETLGTERLVATVSAAFGALAVLLAAVGLYGVLALVVVRRTREIGLRMALGARRNAVLWMVIREALGLLSIGLAVGIPCAYVLGHLVSSQLFGIAPTDTETAAAASLTLAAVAMAAAFLPARRASAIDPIMALRHE